MIAHSQTGLPDNMAQEQQHPGIPATLDFWTVYRIVQHRKWTIVTSMILTVGIAMFGRTMLPTYYEATVTMMPPERILMRPTKVGDINMPVDASLKDERASTLVAMAQSRAVCDMAVKMFDKPISPSALQSKITVDHVIDKQSGHSTSLLRLNIAADKPEDAVRNANAVATSFCDFYSMISHREAAENRKFLEGQQNEAKHKLEQAEHRLRLFTGKKHIARLETQVDTALTSLTELKSERDNAAVRLSELSGNLAVVSWQLSGMTPARKTVEMTSEGSSSASLQAKIADMEKELSLLRSRYTPKHPKIVNLETTLNRARQELSRTSNAMVSRTIVTANPEYEALITRKRELEAERAAQRSKISSLDKTIRKRESELFSYSGTNVDLERRVLDHKMAQSAYSDVSERLYQARIDENLTTETGAIQIIDLADKAKGPFRKGPDQFQFLLGAALLGITLGIGFCMVTEHLDTSIRTVNDASSLVELPVVGVIPSLSPNGSGDDIRQLTHLKPLSPCAESFRFLVTDLLLSTEHSDIKSIMVATAKPHQGGTVTICNLAITLAQAGKRITLVDADLRRPSLHDVFGVDNSIGFSNLLSNGMPVSAAKQKTNIENLTLIPSGSAADNPWKLLRSQRFSQIIDELKQQSDFVLLDSPSAMVFADAVTMAAAVDGVIIVIRANQPPRGNELQLKDLLNKADVKIFGIVLNEVAPQLVDSFYYHNHYYPSVEFGQNHLALSSQQDLEEEQKTES